jgi:hypothetical protein
MVTESLLQVCDLLIDYAVVLVKKGYQRQALFLGNLGF